MKQRKDFKNFTTTSGNSSNITGASRNAAVDGNTMQPNTWRGSLCTLRYEARDAPRRDDYAQ
ncbi:hypothetical protein E2C01_059134 [Portunus trituberculatus]|uniref:Uncharacterized protein n=1 Tax=Portunus trituberculatus TaxID=210409 RepID=A0A5B7GX99_PORTR|nr:hypothetical protein [Portunus trituberculatus]